jgi:transcriptional regulator with XRE-family HTH domain
LKEWRKRRGHSQLDLAVAVRTTQRQVSFIESGRAAPSRDMILRFVGGDGYSVAGGGRPWFVRYA